MPFCCIIESIRIFVIKNGQGCPPVLPAFPNHEKETIMTNAPYVIIGAHGGIGEALATSLLAQGHHVIATARDPSTIAHLCGNVTTAALDAFDPASIEAALSGHDEIKGLAYCAGSIDLAPLKSTCDVAFLKSYELNVLGAIRALRTEDDDNNHGYFLDKTLSLGACGDWCIDGHVESAYLSALSLANELKQNL